MDIRIIKYTNILNIYNVNKKYILSTSAKTLSNFKLPRLIYFFPRFL